jgi:autotransporter-associated beta strand protein
MKTRFKLLFAALGTISFFPSVMAATWTGASSGSWAASGNWTGTAPDNITPQSILFDATSTANLTQTLNASYTLSGITVASPTGAVTVNNGTGTNVLTIGSSGIDLSAATQNLTIVGSNVTIGADQNWNVQTGRTLNVGSSGGTITLTNKLTKTGDGTFTLGGTGATTLTGAGVLEINGGTFTNNMQSGSGSTGRSGATTLTSGTLNISTSISMFGTGALNLNGGAIGSGTTTGRNISNSVNIGGSVRFGGSGLSSGTMTFSGPIDFGGATRSLDSSITGGQGTIFSGKVSNGGLTLNGASTGILTLSNDTNDFTGATTLTSGYLAISNSALATSASVSMAASTRLFIGVNGTTKINNLSGAGTSAIRTDFTITGTSGARALEVTQTSDGTFAGTFTEGGSRPISLTKKGSATLTLSNSTLSYTGATTVDAGKLVINGATSSTTTVNTGGTLGGSGTVGALTVKTGGTLAPGESPGILNSGNLTLEDGSTLAIELNGTTLGTQYDQVNATGTVSLAGLLVLTAGFTPTNGDLFFIIRNNLSDAVSGTFSGLADGSSVFAGLQEFKISYFANAEGSPSFTGGNDVALMAVPEPAAAVLGGLGLLMLLRRRAR